MRNLLNFLIKNSYWFLFLLLEVASFVLLFRFNRYQQSVYFTSANSIIGRIYEASSEVTSYFHLKETNRDLFRRNMFLEQRMLALEENQHERTPYEMDTTMISDSLFNDEVMNYQMFEAKVIKNSLGLADNYLTINRGTKDGIGTEMGVVGPNGVVGIVYMTSSNYSVVISLLNTKSSLSCKIKRSEYFGYLKWENKDARYAYLKDLPRHAEFNLGDTVITSGYSNVFPEGLMVGTIDDMSDSNDGLSYLLKVKLSTDFARVNDVYVISRNGQKEQNELEQKAMQQ